MTPQPLTPIAFPKPLDDTLKEWHSWGAVVDHFLFATTGEVTIDTHYHSAVSGLFAALGGKVGASDTQLRGTISWERLTIEGSEKKSLQEFFGWQFDVNARFLYKQGSTSISYFAPDQEEAASPTHIIYSLPSYELSGDEKGYALALLDPPYNLSLRSWNPFSNSKALTHSRIRESFSKLCDELLGDLDVLEIYSWSTDCSDYFDAGHEWWGSDFWTVYSPTHNWIITILASATD